MQRVIKQQTSVLLHGDIDTSENGKYEVSPKVIWKLEPKMVERVVQRSRRNAALNEYVRRNSIDDE